MIIDGKNLAGEILAKLKKEIQKLPRRLSVGAVFVGKNPASESFLKQKAKIAEILGVNFKIFRHELNISTEKLAKEIMKLNKNQIKNNYPTSRRSSVNGIIVQLPLPKHIKIESVLNVINPKKDIDALSKNPKVLAPTAEAVKFIFQKYKINYKNKNILIVGRGRLVGKPIFNWLNANKSHRQSLRSKCSSVKVKIIDERQKNNLTRYTNNSDIIISGVGKAGLINGNMIKRNAVLIDFGFSKKGNKIFGDFNFATCAKKAKLITPVPGGMGPIMVAMLFNNLIKLNKNPT
ncbi:MAG: bifunctional 5,10-methylenetetrahydrofolate dehydrogenase/5,10-methenyltetrahydrofolate cyclohydrolase [Parcubacteria group bacterium]|nr:bifunctional 5,10-methylenetetrahydrofolate dehydrogenase/5,10-methenyltetrahydrofolate cyclohydrolase [Parcubacteria group bacterium]